MDFNAWLLCDALLAIIGLVALIAWWRMNAFIALTLVSLAAGLGAGMAPIAVAAAFQKGVGDVLGKIAMVIGLGAVLGQMLAASGGAERIAFGMVQGCGRRWLATAWIMAAFLIGIPVFFPVGLVLLIPVAERLAGKLHVGLARFGLPLTAALSVAHGLIPPHPGPMAAIARLNSAAGLYADPGKTILYAVLVGVPTALMAGLAFSRIDFGGDESASEPAAASVAPPAGQPSFWLATFTILLPVGLMLLDTCAQLFLPTRTPLLSWAGFFGDPAVALLIAVLFSFYSLGTARGFSRTQMMSFSSESLLPVAAILLVIGAGGGFGQVLQDAGVGAAISGLAARLPLSPLVVGWLLAAAIRMATGSATVAIITAAGLIAPLAAHSPGLSPELLVLAMGAGSLTLSHVNDGGFWLVQKYVRLTVPQTLWTWTVMETMISVIALSLVLLLSTALPGR